MKTFLVCSNHKKFPEPKFFTWNLIADSGVSNTGKPFFMPEENVSVSLCPLLKVSRLGKSIAKKFSHRYYDEIAPAVHFQLDSLLETLKKENLPADKAVSFDKCLFCDDFITVDTFINEGYPYELWINGELKEAWNVSDCRSDFDSVIANVSEYDTIKIGDLIVPAPSPRLEIRINDRIEIKRDDKLCFSIKIK